jgi:PAS domain S-box-containing protein
MESELTKQMSSLQAGDHLCLFYDSDPAEQMPALIPFIRDGLSSGEQFIYIADDQAVDALSARLEQSEINVGKESDRGALKLWTRREWRQPGDLASAKKFLQVAEFIEDASRAGFKGIRFAVEMTWTLGPDISAERLEHWEATLNTIFVPAFPGRIVCQYNRSRLHPDVMLAALYTHPMLILGDQVHPNLFYEAPLILEGNGKGSGRGRDSAAKVDWIIDQLRRSRAAAMEHQAWIRQSAVAKEAELGRKKIENILSLMPAAVCSCDQEGRITFFNRRAAEVWGREPRLNENSDRYCGSLRLWRVDGSELRHSETPMAAAIKAGQSTRNEELTIERPDGSRIIVNVNVDPLYDGDGHACGAINVFQDITDARRLEEASRRLAAIIESSDDAIISKDLNGTIRSWNHGATRLFGYEADEVIGKPVTTLIPPDRYDEEPGILERIRRGGRIDHYETVRQRKDGSLIEISLSVSPVKDAQGKIIGASKIARDISERKRAEQELSRAKDDLARANQELAKQVQERTLDLSQAKAALLRDLEEQNRLQEQLRQAQKMESIGTLAGGIAHDFNNILNIIKGYISTLSENPGADENFSDSLKVIDDAIERGTATVRQLLTLARKTEAHLASTNSNDIISELAKLLKQTFPKTINVSLQLDRRLPCIMADPSQISQLLLNLCVNARDAMPSGGSLTLRTTLVHHRTLAERHADAVAPWYVCIEVIDTGVGMDAAVRSRIFEPFFTTKGTGQGTGLGLSIVYAIVKNHNAVIDVESQRGRGTTFRLYLPIASVTEKASEETSRREPPAVKAASGRGTILLAEDEENMVQLLKRVLGQRGYQVLVAADGAEAIDLFNRCGPEIDVVLLDIGLPKIAGWDVIRKLKEKDPDVRVVVASGYIEPELKSKMFEAGVKAVVHKPYAIANIIKTLQDVIERSRTTLGGNEPASSVNA